MLQKLFQDDGRTQSAKNKQIFVLLISILVITAAIVFMVLLPGGNNAKKVPFASDSKQGTKIKISTVTDGVRAEDRWIEEAGNKLQKIEKISQENNKLQADIALLQKQAKESQLSKDDIADHKVVVDAYDAQVKQLEARISELEGRKQNTQAITPDKPITNPLPANPQNGAIGGMNDSAAHGGILSMDFSLEDEIADDTNSFDTSHYLPAGSYVPAIVISGVDASVGVSSQGDPRPVLFRVSGDAVSAVFDGKEPQKVDIKGCTVTGAASGDLSSEKVFVRLLKMTCSRKSGKVIETEVHGYVTAVGKAGVRGPVVSREGDLVTKSFFAGLAGGVGNGFSQSLTTPATIVGGVATQTPDVRSIAGQGIGKGVQSSADRLADYLIKRAEQYQPVITMSAGIDVELVFNDGVYLDGKNRAVKKIEVKKNG